jgi:electron transport complex protein RnfA
MTFSALISLAFGSFIVNNIILAQFLGICSFLGVSKKRSSALGMGLAVLGVITLSSMVTWVLYKYVLDPVGLDFMKTIIFILVIASVVQILEMAIKKFIPPLYKALGVYLPLITTNCAVLGVALLTIQNEFTFVETVVYAFFTSLGYMVIIFTFSFIREQIERAPIPEGFKGIPIGLVAASIMALIFKGFAGLL